MLEKRLREKIRRIKMRMGFEIEGVFSIEFYEKMKKRGDFKNDYSVKKGSIIRQWELNEDDLIDYEEFSSKIFESYDEMIENLSYFEPKNGYFFDKEEWSSGLHFHVSLPNIQTAFLLASDWRKFKRFQENFILKNYKERVESGGYCFAYRDKRSFIKAFYTGDKYRTMRFHPHGTLEFRFLYPDERRIEAVNQLLKFLLKEVFKTEYLKFEAILDQQQFDQKKVEFYKHEIIL